MGVFLRFRSLFRAAESLRTAEPTLNGTLSAITRLFERPSTTDELAAQVEVLRGMLLSSLQEIETLKALLRERQVWDEAIYRRLRIEQMINDHSSAGPWPQKFHSHYRYVLGETDFLREALSASQSEIDGFAQRRHQVRRYT